MSVPKNSPPNLQEIFKMQTALRQFEAANEIQEQDPIFSYDPEEQKREQEGRPWKDDVHYFKKVGLSGATDLGTAGQD